MDIFSYDSDLSQFTTYNEDIANADTYPLRIKVRYEGEPTHYTTFGTLDFNVVLVDPCITADLTLL